MLRLYTPIENDDIFSLHEIIEHLVVDVWCKADSKLCSSKMSDELKAICHYSYKKGTSFGKEIVRIYLLFKNLDQGDRDNIVNAFHQSNQIEELCDRSIEPIRFR